MAFTVPQEGETLYCTKDGVSVYQSASKSSPKSLTNNQYNDHSLRDYQKGEPIGTVISKELFTGPDNTQFLKIRNWVWIWVDDGFIKVGLAGHNEQEFHENYVCIDDEPFGWIRDSWRFANIETSEHDSKTAEIESYISQYPGLPKPSSVSKRTATNGSIHWDITFPNGATVDFDNFKDLSPETKVTVATRDPLKPATLTDTKTVVNTSTGKKTTFFTTQNVLIGCVIVGLATVIVLLLRPRHQ